MRYTNKFNLPQPFVYAVTNDDYSSGDADISVTGLLKPPGILFLERKHAKEIQEDVSDRVWALLGKLMHLLLELSSAKDKIRQLNEGLDLTAFKDALGEERYQALTRGKVAFSKDELIGILQAVIQKFMERGSVSEKRYSMGITSTLGISWKVSGGLDHQLLVEAENGVIIQDYKLCSVYKVKDGVPEDFESQLNAYAELLRQNGKRVIGLQLIPVLRDWSRTTALRDDSYPQAQVYTLPVALWPQAQAQQFLIERVSLHQRGRLERIPCSNEDRWHKPGKIAVMVKGAARAKKLFDVDERAQAERYAATFKGGYVEERRGEYPRCESYCSVSRFCPQVKAGQANKTKKENTNDEE